MTSRQFMKLFELRPAYYVAHFHEPNNIHKRMLAYYRDHVDYAMAKKELDILISSVGFEKTRMFYIESVYESVMKEKKKESRKQLFAPSIAAIMANAGNKS